jgi:hypothetical protein
MADSLLVTGILPIAGVPESVPGEPGLYYQERNHDEYKGF